MSLSRAAFKTRQAGAAHGPLHPGWVHSDIMVLLLGPFEGCWVSKPIPVKEPGMSSAPQ